MGLVLVSVFKEKSCGHQKPSEESAGCSLTRRGRQNQWPRWSTLKEQVSSQAGFFPPWFTGQPSHRCGTWLPGLSWFGAIGLEWSHWGYHLIFLQMSYCEVFVNRVNHLPNSAPKTQILKKCSFFRHAGEPFCALYKQKITFWSVHAFPKFRESMAGLSSDTESIPCSNTEELSPACSSWGGEALVVPTGCTDKSWPDVKLIKSCNFKTQEREIRTGPSCFFCLLCYPSSFTCICKSKQNQWLW